MITSVYKLDLRLNKKLINITFMKIYSFLFLALSLLAFASINIEAKKSSKSKGNKKISNQKESKSTNIEQNEI